MCVGGGGGGGGEVSSTFDQFGRMNQKGKEKKRKKEEGEKKKSDRERKRGRKGKRGKDRFSRRFDGRSSKVRELKSVHAMRATHGYQSQWVSSNSKR